MKKILSIVICASLLLGMLCAFTTGSLAAFEGDDKIVIVLDPGHGGGNVGTAARGVGEKTYTLKLARLLRDELLANGNFTVYMTRDGDYDLDLYRRAEIANEYDADILISLHFDGNPVASLNGVTTFTSVIDEYATTELSASIAAKLSAATGLKNNGVVRRNDTEGYYWNYKKQWDCKDSSLGTLSDYYTIPTWCTKFGIPSIIVEHGFFSNAGDVNIIFAEGTLEKMAKAEAEAIISYFTNHQHVYSSAREDYPSNCMYTGKKSEHCSICRHRRGITPLAPAPDNHYWVVTSQNKSSCGVDGKTVYECRITRSLEEKGWTGEIHTKTTVVPAPSQHNFVVSDEKAVTHTKDGYKQYTCTNCSFSFRDIYKAEGHSYSLTADADPDCTNKGYRTYKCSVCNHEYTEESAPLGHSLPNGSTAEPTCTQDGYTKGNCTRCNEELNETTPALGHSFETVSKLHPTCTEEGRETLRCSRCLAEETKNTPEAGHTYESSSSPALCEKDGLRTYTCSVCSHSYSESIPKTGHQKSEKGSVSKKATLFKEGEKEYECKNACGKHFSEKIPSLFAQHKAMIVPLAAGFGIVLLLAFLTVVLLLKKKKKAPLPIIAPAEDEKIPKEDDEPTLQEEEQTAESGNEVKEEEPVK
ncbi:MAG: N-acetylmuramoyl-L-alanine amidase [Ruminococcaceae bacterium]|nr:N-acetylmuramoyl-L-alanine amidase [Oscillospiraceae bacterium]